MKLLNKAIFATKKNSPTILMVVGGAAVIGSVVLACKATPKAMTIIDDMKNTRETIEECWEKVQNDGYDEETYSESDYKKDIAMNYLQTSVKLAKAFAPTAGAVVISLGCIYGSHYILNKRFIALSSAYSIIDTSFKKYRGNVVERFGSEVDKELRGIKAVEITEEVEEEDGTKKTTTKVVQAVDDAGLSDYSIIFDPMSDEYVKDGDYNWWFLRKNQDYFNDKLKIGERVFLRDVLKTLGWNPNDNSLGWLGKASHVVGWDPDGDGDKKIDFGCFDEHGNPKYDPREPNIWLDFNVDGNIWIDM